MIHSLAARPLRWGSALAIAAAAALTFTAGANATIYRPADGPELEQDIVLANANPGRDVIVFESPSGSPLFLSPNNPITITDNLLLTGNHAYQASNELPVLDGSTVTNRAADFITIAPGVRVDIEGLTITLGSEVPFAVLKNNGTLRLDGVAMFTNDGRALDNPAGSNATLVNTLINSNNSLGIFSRGSLTMINSTVTENFSGGVDARGTFVLRNSIIANNNSIRDCFALPTAESGNLDSDGSCGNAATADPKLDAADFFGGPTQSPGLQAGSPAINAGDNAFCPPVDQRFFRRSDGQCDIGAYEVGGARDTTPPSCVVSATRNGPPKQQDVTLSDGQSGIGPDGVWDSTDVTITNGSVAFSPLTAVSLSPAGLVLTATKTDEAQSTRWSFVARDWAGNVKNCS